MRVPRLGKHGLTNSELIGKINVIKRQRKGEKLSARQISNILQIWYDKDINVQRIGSILRYQKLYKNKTKRNRSPFARKRSVEVDETNI